MKLIALLALCFSAAAYAQGDCIWYLSVPHSEAHSVLEADLEGATVIAGSRQKKLVAVAKSFFSTTFSGLGLDQTPSTFVQVIGEKGFRFGLPLKMSRIERMVFSPDGRMLVAGGRSGEVAFVNIAEKSAQIFAPFFRPDSDTRRTPPEGVTQLWFRDDRTLIASGSYSQAYLYQIEELNGSLFVRDTQRFQGDGTLKPWSFVNAGHHFALFRALYYPQRPELFSIEKKIREPLPFDRVEDGTTALTPGVSSPVVWIGSPKGRIQNVNLSTGEMGSFDLTVPADGPAPTNLTRIFEPRAIVESKKGDKLIVVGVDRLIQEGVFPTTLGGVRIAVINLDRRELISNVHDPLGVPAVMPILLADEPLISRESTPGSDILVLDRRAGVPSRIYRFKLPR